jgi:hypothetical protein
MHGSMSAAGGNQARRPCGQAPPADPTATWSCTSPLRWAESAHAQARVLAGFVQAVGLKRWAAATSARLSQRTKTSDQDGHSAPRPYRVRPAAPPDCWRLPPSGLVNGSDPRYLASPGRSGRGTCAASATGGPPGQGKAVAQNHSIALAAHNANNWPVAISGSYDIARSAGSSHT